MLSNIDRIVLNTMESIELACRAAAGKPDPALAIADAIARNRRILLDELAKT